MFSSKIFTSQELCKLDTLRSPILHHPHLPRYVALFGLSTENDNANKVSSVMHRQSIHLVAPFFSSHRTSKRETRRTYSSLAFLMKFWPLAHLVSSELFPQEHARKPTIAKEYKKFLRRQRRKTMEQ